MSPPASNIPASGDHRAWAAWWGESAMRSIVASLEPNRDERFVVFDLEHVRRASRLAFWHAARVTGYRYWDKQWVEDL